MYNNVPVCVLVTSEKVFGSADCVAEVGEAV